jgi:D-arabinose 1-dehydrogenase-like Zn-dependent alcohol dehydrogenase
VNDDQVAVAVLASSRTIGGLAVIGTVVETGEHARSLIDKRVLVGPIDPCGECDVCRRGGAAVCPTLTRRTEPADRILAAARWAVPLDIELPMPGAAAVAGDVALAYTLYARTGLGPREPTVVVGASPIARFLIEILRAKGIAPVVVVDPESSWAYASERATVARTRDEVVAGIAAQGIAGRTWRVIAAAIDDATVARAAELAGPRATLTLLAPIAALPAELVAREVTIISVAGAHPDLVVEVAAMCAKGEIDLVNGTTDSENADMRTIVRLHP